MTLLPGIIKSNNEAVSNFAARSIMRNYSDAFTSQEFLDLDVEGLIEILKWDKLAIPEIEIYNGAYRWAENRVANRLGRILANGDEKSLEISKELQDVLKCIRFPLMTPDEFGACGAVKLMKNEDKKTISSYMFFLSQGDLEFLNNPENDPRPFNKARRSAPHGTNSNMDEASQNPGENQIMSSIPSARSDSEETENCENISPVGFADVIGSSQPEINPASAINDVEAVQSQHSHPQIDSEQINSIEPVEMEQSTPKSASKKTNGKESTVKPESIEVPESNQNSSRATSAECFANESLRDSDKISIRSRKRSLAGSVSSLATDTTEVYDPDDDVEIPQPIQQGGSGPGPALKKLHVGPNSRPDVSSGSDEDDDFDDGDDIDNGSSNFMDPGSSLSTIVYNVDDFEDPAPAPSDTPTLDDFYATYQETKMLELNKITALDLVDPLLITSTNRSPIILKNLRTLSISYIYKGSPVSRAPDGKYIPLPTYLESLDLPKNLLFVRPSPQMSSEEFLKSLWKCDTTILVKIDGITILHKNKDSLTVSGLWANVNPILSGLQNGPPLTTLQLASISIPSFDGIPTLNLKSLSLKDVSVELEPLQNFLNKSPNLLEVSIHIAKREKSNLKFNLDLSFNAPKLRSLALGSMDKLKCSGSLGKLEGLFINGCNVRGLVKNFSERFPSLKKIQIYNPCISSYLAVVLAKHPKCQWIGYSGRAKWTSGRVIPGKDVMKAAQKEFLKLSGLLKVGWKDFFGNRRRTFILKSTSSKGKWKAQLMDTDLGEFANIEYANFNWPAFYDDREAYLNWNRQTKHPTRLPTAHKKVEILNIG